MLVVYFGVSAPIPTLETASTELTWNDEGGLALVVDRPSQTRFAAGDKAAPLYALQLADPELDVDSSQATRRECHREGQAVVWESEHREQGLKVICRFEPEAGSGLIRARIEVRCSPDRKLAAVRFPIVQLGLPLGTEGADDDVVVPCGDGALIRDPLQKKVDVSYPYPGMAAMQLLAAYDRSAGVYLACRDAEGYTKQLKVSRTDKRLQLAITHLPEQNATGVWKPAYDCVLTTFRGSRGPNSTRWEDAAEIYRTWALRQPWCRETLSQRVKRGDVPRWLVEPSLFHAFSIRGNDAAGKPTNRLNSLVEQAEGWREVIGAPVTMMLMAWEKQGAWITPDYFPPFGGREAFQEATRRLHEKGHHTLVFLSGLKWTLNKVRPDGVWTSNIHTEAEFQSRAASQAVSDAAGKPTIFGAPNTGVGQYAQICSTTPLACDILLGSSMKCQQLGIDCVQADQIVGGGMPPCFHPDHKHPAGGGRWCTKALYDRFAEIRREGQKRSKDFAFSIEEPTEFFIPVLDVYHARDYAQVSFPRTPLLFGVPLFTHVYHEYLLGYGGDSANITMVPSDRALYHQAMNLVCGKTAGGAVWSMWFDPQKVDPAQKRVLRAHVELWRGEAGEFLIYGRRVPSPDLAVPTVEIGFPPRFTLITGKQGHQEAKLVQHSLPSVLHSVWELPDGRRGAVLVSINSEPVTVDAFGQHYRLEPGQAVWTTLPKVGQ
jgi:hypothetical protein